MLKILDEKGRTKYILSDDSTEPLEISDNEQEENEQCKPSVTGKETKEESQ